MENIFQRVQKFSGNLFGRQDSQSLYVILYGDEILREKLHYTEVPLLATDGANELNARIEKICVYRDGPTDTRFFHAFVVFKTAKCYYTLERWAHHISLQRSRSMEQIVQNYNGEERENGFHRETDWVDGEGTVWDMISLLLSKKVFERKFNALTNNCQNFAALVFKNSNSEGARFQTYRESRAGFALRRVKSTNNLDLYAKDRQRFWLKKCDVLKNWLTSPCLRAFA